MMNRFKSIFYAVESVIVLILALLMLFNIIVAIVLKGGPMGYGVIILIVNGLIGTLGFLCWLWRNFLKNNPIEGGVIHAFVFILNRCVLYFLMGLGFLLNYDVPSTLRQAKNHRIELRKQRFEQRFFMQIY